MERTELEELRERILNVVGHALATHVPTLRGLADALGEGADPSPDVIAAIRRTAAKLEHLLDDVLVASGVDTRLPPGPAEPTPVAAMVREVWAEVGDGGELEVRGDAVAQVQPRTLRWMLRHALDNVARYGDPPRSVTISREGPWVRIEVRNRTDPLTPEDVANAFELFYRGEYAVMRSGAGLGVGLTVVRRLVAHAGGSVSFAVDGQDAILRLELPRA